MGILDPLKKMIDSFTMQNTNFGASAPQVTSTYKPPSTVTGTTRAPTLSGQFNPWQLANQGLSAGQRVGGGAGSIAPPGILLGPPPAALPKPPPAAPPPEI